MPFAGWASCCSLRGGALRIWPVFVLGRRFSGLVAIQPGHTLVTTGIYSVIRNPSYLGLLIISSAGAGLPVNHRRPARGSQSRASRRPHPRRGALARSQFGADTRLPRAHVTADPRPVLTRNRHGSGCCHHFRGDTLTTACGPIPCGCRAPGFQVAHCQRSAAMDEAATTAGLSHEITDLERQTMARVARRLLPLLIACYFVAYLDRVNVGFASLTMNKALGFSRGCLRLWRRHLLPGLLHFRSPQQRAAQQGRRRIWIARILITWGIISGCTAFVRADCRSIPFASCWALPRPASFPASSSI